MFFNPHDDKSITEIMINGPDSIFIERDGRVSKLNVKFEKSTQAGGRNSDYCIKGEQDGK